MLVPIIGEGRVLDLLFKPRQGLGLAFVKAQEKVCEGKLP